MSIYPPCVLSHIWLFVTPWTAACQAPLSMEFSKQACWSGLPFPPLGDLPDPGIEPPSLASTTLAGGFLTTMPPGKLHIYPQLFTNKISYFFMTWILARGNTRSSIYTKEKMVSGLERKYANDCISKGCFKICQYHNQVVKKKGVIQPFNNWMPSWPLNSTIDLFFFKKTLTQFFTVWLVY